VTKLAVIPCTVLLQYLLYRTGIALTVAASLVVLTIGVGIATITALEVNFEGFVVALIGVVTTSFQQIVRLREDRMGSRDRPS